MLREICIIGAGGGGSNLAHMLVRDNLMNKFFDRLHIVDYDTVELKNLQRQFYFLEDIEGLKVNGLKNSLNLIDSELAVYTYPNKILSERSLELFDKDMLCVCCTDDVKGKQLITNYFNNYIILSNDGDIIEITVDKAYLNTWSFGTGYSAIQHINNNMFVCCVAFGIIKDFFETGELPTKNIKFNIKTLELIKD